MAFCKNCNKEIEDGEVYCDACKAEESYLDDLLNFVMQENDEQKAVHQISKNEEANEETSDDMLAEEHEDEINNMLGDIFGQDVITDSEISVPEDEDSLGEDNIQDILSNLELLSEEEIPQVNTENFGDMSDDVNDVSEVDYLTDLPDEDSVAYADLDMQSEPESYTELIDSPEPEIYTDFMDTAEPEVFADLDESAEPQVYTDFMDTAEPEVFTDLTSMPSNDDGGEGELFDIDELLGNNQLFNEDTSSEVAATDEQTINLGEDDDILRYLQTLNDGEEISDYDEIPSVQAINAETEASKTEEAKNAEKKTSDKSSKKKDAKGFFKKIFGNVKEERTPEEVEKLKNQALAKYEADEQKKQAEKVRAAKAKEEKQKKKELDDAAKQEQKLAKQKAALEKKKHKEQEKKLAKDKKALEKKRILDEIDEYEGSINKIGASIVFLLFGTLLVFIVAGTNIYTYNIAIKNAQKDFDNKEYNEAYDKVAGIDILEEDIVLYERIMTVMYVNKQLNSYYNFMVLDKPELALDSLLKGLMRYDKYIAYARQLEITDHLDYVKSTLLQELELEFELDETEAYDIIRSDSQEEYSNMIIEMTSSIEE